MVKINSELQFQHSILYGTLLGDSDLYPKKGIIQIEQCLQHQESLFWLFENLKSLTTGKIPSLVTRLDKRTQTFTKSYRFYTKALFHEWRLLFYNEKGIKKLPHNFSESLDSVAFTIWFLDDGGKCSGVKKGVFLILDNYTLDEIEIIQHTFKVRFGIKTQLHWSGKSSQGLQQKRLTITGDDYSSFYEIVLPIISQIPTMENTKLAKI